MDRKHAVVDIVEPGFGVIQVQHGVVVVGGVLLHQIQLPLAALEDGVVGDLVPLIVAGPRDDLAVDRAGQVIGGPQVVGVIVGVQLTVRIQQRRRAFSMPCTTTLRRALSLLT